MRPRTLDEIVGQEHLLAPGKFLSQMVAAHVLHSMILWGPPGTGKTTLAIVLAEQSGAVFRKLAAVTSGVADLRDAVEAARHDLEAGKRTVVFIDEIHRWNRAQQDAFLPHVESGLITLIGATTENPSFEVISALLSRMRLLVLHPLSEENVATLVHRALADKERGLGNDRTQAGCRRDRRDRSLRRRRRAARARHARDCGGVRAKRGRDDNHARTHSRIGAAEGSALRSRRRRALQRNFSVHQEHARQRSRRVGVLDDAHGRGGRGSAVHRAPDGNLRVRRRRQRRPARAASRDRGEGGGGLRRDAGRRDSARAGRDLSRERAEVQRVLSRDARGGRRCENAWRAAGAAASCATRRRR